MKSIREAFHIVEANLPARKSEKQALENATGYILAQDIFAVEPSPRYTNSAMDGFAARWQDIETASSEKPVALSLMGESQAGIPFRGELSSGEAAHISTGAMICAGADAVVPVEETTFNGDKVLILKAKKQYQHIRFAGEEFQAGALLVKAGAVLNPSQIALLASQGITEIPVYARPKVAIIATGTELVPYDQPLKPWEIRDSNSIMLYTAVEKSGGEVSFSGHVGDDYKKTVAAVQKAMGLADIILFSGGVSVGPHDHVKKAAQECGFETLFWRVLQKPGKPLFFAGKDTKLFFGLPGNPVSAYMCYLYYIHPVLRHLHGESFGHEVVQAKVLEPIENRLPRAQLFRIALRRRPGELPDLMPLKKQGSHMLTSVSEAAGFILLEVDTFLKAGDIVDVLMF